MVGCFDAQEIYWAAIKLSIFNKELIPIGINLMGHDEWWLAEVGDGSGECGVGGRCCCSGVTGGCVGVCVVG